MRITKHIIKVKKAESINFVVPYKHNKMCEQKISIKG